MLKRDARVDDRPRSEVGAQRKGQGVEDELLAESFTRIARAPKLRPPYAVISNRSVWRVLPTKTEQHAYYTVDDTRDEVVMETVWGARRARGPRL